MESLLNSQFGLKLGLAIAKSTPPRLGYAVARWIARWISSQPNSPIVQAVHLNQQQVSGGSLDPDQLDHAVREVFRYTARSFYDLYHHLNQLEKAEAVFTIEPSFQRIIDRPKFDQQGLVLAGLHMSGFDLAYQWLCLDLLEPLGITLPNPQGGRALELQRRMELGLNLVQGTFDGIRQAIRFLKKGGMVVTGIDRPDEIYQPRPIFFGSPASLPTHHVFLALKARCPVVFVSTRLETDGRYHVSASAPIEMDQYPNRDDQLKLNGEKILATAEEFIRRDPHQWLITQPIWMDPSPTE